MYWVDSTRMLNLVMKLICFLFFNIIKNFMKVNFKKLWHYAEELI
jgi:hypothetical protein